MGRRADALGGAATTANHAPRSVPAMNLIALRLSVGACFLARAGDGYLLVDSGYEADWEVFQQRLREAKVALSDVHALIVTHHDDDHCGLLTRIVEANPSIRVIMSEFARPLLEKGENDRSHGRHLVNRRVAFILSLKAKRVKVWLKTGRWVDGGRELRFPPYRARPSDILISGETALQDVGVPLNGRILPTPGHTVDSISVVFDDGDALVGDAAANMLQWAGTRYHVIALDDLAEYERSWRRLIVAGAQRIFPAHGAPFPVARLKENMLG